MPVDQCAQNSVHMNQARCNKTAQLRRSLHTRIRVGAHSMRRSSHTIRIVEQKYAQKLAHNQNRVRRGVHTIRIMQQVGKSCTQSELCNKATATTSLLNALQATCDEVEHDGEAQAQWRAGVVLPDQVWRRAVADAELRSAAVSTRFEGC